MHPHIILVGRLLLASVWITAGISKLARRGAAAQTVVAFHILPERLALLLGRALPWAEVSLGVMMLLGVQLQIVSLVSVVLLFGFSLAIAVNLLRGREIECNCFGQLARSRISWLTLLRNLGIIAVAILILCNPLEYMALDGLANGTMIRPGDPAVMDFLPVLFMALGTAVVAFAGSAILELARAIASAEDGPALGLPERLVFRRWLPNPVAADPASNNGA